MCLVISQKSRWINTFCAASSFFSPRHGVTLGSASTEAQTKSLPEGGVEDKSGDDDNDLLLIQLSSL